MNIKMVKRNEGSDATDNQPQRRALRSAAARLLRRSQRNKDNGAEPAGKGKVRRVGSVVLTSSAKMKKTAQRSQPKSRSGTATHSRRWTAKERPESEVRVARITKMQGDVQVDDSPLPLHCSEGAITATDNVQQIRDSVEDIEAVTEKRNDTPRTSRRGTEVPAQTAIERSENMDSDNDIEAVTEKRTKENRTSRRGTGQSGQAAVEGSGCMDSDEDIEAVMDGVNNANRTSRRGTGERTQTTNEASREMVDMARKTSNDEDSDEVQSMPRATVIVEKAAWLSLKGQLGRATAEIVRLDGHIALLNRSNDRLERECTDLKATITTLRAKERPNVIDCDQTVFRAVRRRANALLNMDELQNVFTRERVQLAIQPCFAEIYSRMFHLCKRTTTETTWQSLFVQTVDVETSLSDVDRTIVTDWRNFMVQSKPVSDDIDGDSRVSWNSIVAAQVKVRENSLKYIPECLYSRHMKGECFRMDVHALKLALHEFAFVHMKVMNPHMNTFTRRDMEKEV